ncbi:MAG TPA: acetate kinase [Stenomitos sp.]
MKILVLNAGSSSQKSCVYDLPETHLPTTAPPPLWECAVDWSHHAGVAELKIQTQDGAVLEESIPTQKPLDSMAHVLECLWQGKTKVMNDLKEISVVGHRVVHGGTQYQDSVFVNTAVKAAIADLARFAPLHNPSNLEGIEAIEQVLGNIPQVAVFDTAFHRTLPLAATLYPGLYAWYQQGIQRYGFHGISHQYCAQRAAQLMGRDLKHLRLIVCHLGNGCSLCAIGNGQSIDTTMGFTPLDGLMMGTRSGAIDPSIIIYLLRNEGYTPEAVEKLLNRESGLKGISGLSSDMRQIEAAISEGNTQAQLAFDLFIHRLRSSIGAMLATLGGLDALVFTGGIGEHSSSVRDAACCGFDFLGLKLDGLKNEAHPIDQDIAAPDSTIRIFAIHTQEDWAITKECWQLITQSSRDKL